MRLTPGWTACPRTAARLSQAVSIHTHPAIKLEKRELAGREVDRLQIYITAEAAGEESVREGDGEE